jgi:hypothetical protein
MERSAEAIRTYTRCPREYYIKYEKDLPESRTRFKDFLDNVLASFAKDSVSKIMRDTTRYESTYLRQWREAVRKVPPNVDLCGQNPASLIDEYTGYAMNFYKLTFNTIKPAWTIHGINIDFEETFNNNISVAGTIDILAKSNHGDQKDIFVLDLHKTPHSDFFNRSSIWEWFKVHGYRKLTGQTEKGLFMLCLKSPNDNLVALPKPNNFDMKKMNNEISNICKHLTMDLEENTWCPNYTWACEKMCNYQDICGGMEREPV